MKKRRSTVYVRPGKDVTLYVPVETPPEVVDYMNELKQEGMFSQGIIDILSDYVQRQGRPPRLDSEEKSSRVLESKILDAGVVDPRVSDRRDSRHLGLQETGLEQASGETAGQTAGQTAATFEIDSGLPTGNHVTVRSNTSSSDHSADSSGLGQQQSSAKLNLAQIFQQAQRNSGKLVE